MVHNIVKVVNIVRAQSTSHIDVGASIAEMESEMTLDLESDKFRCFNHRR